MHGRTALHVACDHDAPAVVVAALLQVLPKAAVMVGTSNMNPLHITCSSSHASIHVLRVLLGMDSMDSASNGTSSNNSETQPPPGLQGYVEESLRMRDVDGDTPLHAACRCGAPMDVLELLLKAYPEAVHQRDYEGLTPLLRLWVRYVVILGDDVLANIQGPADVTGQLLEAWQKTELLLKYAYHQHQLLEQQEAVLLPPMDNINSIGEEKKMQAETDATITNHDHTPTPFSVVHAVAAVDCPRPVVRIATVIYPHQVLEKDAQGRTPLLIAAKSPVFKVRDLSDGGYMLEDRIHGDDVASNPNNSILEDEDTSGQPSVVNILLDASREAARIRDPNGRLPVHLALKTGKRWNQGVGDLIHSYPEGLNIPGPSTKLVPFQLAAWGTKTDLNTLFETLRTNPALLGAVNMSALI